MHRYTISFADTEPITVEAASLEINNDGGQFVNLKGEDGKVVLGAPSHRVIYVHRIAAEVSQADAWDEGFEAGSEFTAHNPGPSGISSDPPRNPYDE